MNRPYSPCIKTVEQWIIDNISKQPLPNTISFDYFKGLITDRTKTFDQEVSALLNNPEFNMNAAVSKLFEQRIKYHNCYCMVLPCYVDSIKTEIIPYLDPKSRLAHNFSKLKSCLESVLENGGQYNQSVWDNINYLHHQYKLLASNTDGTPWNWIEADKLYENVASTFLKNYWIVCADS